MSKKSDHPVIEKLKKLNLLQRFSLIPLNGKVPFERKWEQWCAERRELKQEDFFDKKGSPLNVGICCGKASSVLVLDVDDVNIFEDYARSQGWVIPKTLTVQTGRGGIHYYYNYPDDGNIYSNASKGNLGFDIRGAGGQIVAPGSIHPDTGKAYKILRQHKIAAPPSWLLDLAKHKNKPLKAETNNISKNKDLTLADLSIIKKMKRKKSEIFKKLWEGDFSDDFPSQSEADFHMCRLLASETQNAADRIDRIFRQSGLFREKWDEPRPGGTYGQITIKIAIENGFHLTDLGNAERLIYLHGDNLRRCIESDKWLHWKGDRWEYASAGNMLRIASDTAKSIIEEANKSSNLKKKKDIIAHQKKSESRTSIKAMIELSKGHEGVALSEKDFDQPALLLNVKNGTIDLETGKLLPHERHHYLTKIIPIEYHPQASPECSNWLTFLGGIFSNNDRLINYVQRVIGYSLTGSVQEQKLFILYGTGANGKSTLIETIRSLMAPYATQASYSTFTAEPDNHKNNDLARMKGARFVTAVEIDSTKRLDEELIKRITGGDVVTARLLFHEPFEYQPQYKLFLTANSLPEMSTWSPAISRRINIIPFNVTIPHADQNQRLKDILLRELPGILHWSVNGCLLWQRDGLNPPPEVCVVNKEYFERNDDIGCFIHDSCMLSVDERVRPKELYSAYEDWCTKNSLSVMTTSKFWKILEAKNFRKTKCNGKRYIKGIRLKRRSGR